MVLLIVMYKTKTQNVMVFQQIEIQLYLIPHLLPVTVKTENIQPIFE